MARFFLPFFLLVLFFPPVWGEEDLRSGQQALLVRNYPLAFSYFHHSAQKGDPAGECALGLMYENGYGVEKDYAQAKVWFERSARKGDPGGQNNLGWLYRYGKGVPRDDKTALGWFIKAAGQGLASAQLNIALMAARGEGMKKDAGLAYIWFEKAALQGDDEAQVNLGQMLSLGEGTPKDLVESYKWFSVASNHPDLSGDKRDEIHDDLEWLEKHMTGDQVREAQRRADRFKTAAEEGDLPTPAPPPDGERKAIHP
jgi:TPR repeat protein